MKSILILLLAIASIQVVRASATYYDSQSAAFVLVDEGRIQNLRDGKAILRVAVKPPANMCGVVGAVRIEITDFPVRVLSELENLKEPAFLVFYSKRDILTDKKGEGDATVRLGGGITYEVGILTAADLYSLTEEGIELHKDTASHIDAYRKFISHEDTKTRDFYLSIWAGE